MRTPVDGRLAGATPTRRDVVRRLGLAGAGLALGAAGWPAPVSGVAPSPAAGPGAGERRFEPLGLQLYSVRDEMARDVPGTLSAVAAMGYTEVEFAGYFEHGPAGIRRMVADAGLRAPASHVAPDFESDAWSRIVETAVEAGHSAVIVAWIPEAMRDSAESWRRTADAMARAGEVARDAGLSFGYHNHDVEFARFGGGPDDPAMQGEGPTGLELLLRHTDPDQLFIELDLYWTADAGFDPVATVERIAPRVRMVHVKDRTSDGRMVDVGAGDLDWPRILAACRGVGIEHFFVEHDRPEGGSLRFARASAAYLRALD